MTYEIKNLGTPYSGPVFSVERLDVVLPDLHTHTYDRVAMQNAVTILPIDDEGNVYFVRQFRVGSNSVLLELPAGKVEKGEEAQATAEREIREEIGMAARKLVTLGGFFVSPGYSTEYMDCFLATGLYADALSPDADEFLNVEKIPLDKVREMIFSGGLPDGKSLGAFLLAWHMLDNI
jgi:ADP-ribose pyrophosphatase